MDISQLTERLDGALRYEGLAHLSLAEYGYADWWARVSRTSKHEPVMERTPTPGIKPTLMRGQYPLTLPALRLPMSEKVAHRFMREGESIELTLSRNALNDLPFFSLMIPRNFSANKTLKQCLRGQKPNSFKDFDFDEADMQIEFAATRWIIASSPVGFWDNLTPFQYAKKWVAAFSKVYYWDFQFTAPDDVTWASEGKFTSNFPPSFEKWTTNAHIPCYFPAAAMVANYQRYPLGLPTVCLPVLGWQIHRFCWGSVDNILSALPKPIGEDSKIMVSWCLPHADSKPDEEMAAAAKAKKARREELRERHQDKPPKRAPGQGGI